MLRRLLFMVFALGSFNSLIPSSAAADVKTAHHLQATHAATQQPLYFPEGTLRSTLSTVIWLREHPSYVNALISTALPVSLAQSHWWRNPSIVNILLDLKAHIVDENLTNYILNSESSSLLREAYAPFRLAGYVLPTLIKIIDRLLEQGSSIRSLHQLLTKEKAYFQESLFQGRYQLEEEFRTMLFDRSLEYLNLLEQSHKERAAAIREALAPALLPPLINIATEYDVPAPARPVAKPPSTPIGKVPAASTKSPK